ncbi:MAG: hypothetical protein QXL14_00385 [Candidatus Aenigmatarchaeota archaeon]
MKPLLAILAGIGLDELLRRVSIAYPELQKPTGIRIPGYDPAGIHYDDLIALIASGAVATYGAYKKDYDTILTGILMAVASYIQSTIIAERWK